MLSLCMIVKDEEDVIGRAIASVQEIADDIVVVDTGSNDKTVEIAQGFGARIYHFTWNYDFSEAKNFAVSKALSDWIFVLDADETIAERDLKKILKLTRDNVSYGYSLIQRSYCDKQNITGWVPNPMDYEEGNGYSGYHPSKLVRLFRNDSRIRFKGRIHELVEGSMLDNGLPVRDTDIPIHHYGMTRGPVHFRNKLLHYAELEEKRAREETMKPELLLRAAALYRETGLIEKAMLLLNEIMSVKPEFAEAYHEVALLSETISDFAKAEEYYCKAINYSLDNPVFLYNYANLLMKTGRSEESVKYLLKVIQLKPGHFNAHYMLGEIYFKAGDLNKSIFHFRKAIQLFPNNEKAKNNLGVVYYSMGKKKEAETEFSEAVRINPEYGIARFYLGVIYAEKGQKDDARKEIELSVRLDPDNKEAKRILTLL